MLYEARKTQWGRDENMGNLTEGERNPLPLIQKGKMKSSDQTKSEN